MTTRVQVSASAHTKASPERAFALLVDPAAQSRWMLGTTTAGLSGDVEAPAVGSRMMAFTSIAGLGFLDLMTVTELDAPHRWVVEHNGTLIRGDGIFTVEKTATGSTITWADDVDLPFGVFGRIGWIAIRPGVAWGFRASLKKLAKLLDAEVASQI